jgi:hypothetical protein
MGETTCKTMLRSYCFGNGSTTFDGLKKRNFSPRFQACRRAKSARTKGMARRKLSGELGKKNQTDTGRVSQYTSPLQRNVCLFSQAIGN